MVRYTELPPTGSETSNTDRQSEIVAAINGPITHLLLPKGEKVQSFLARAWAYVSLGGCAQSTFAFSNIDEVGVACLGNDNSGSNDHLVIADPVRRGP